MDIRKLQRTIVDALEDVKAQDIQVFNTEALTSLFDRVVVASATSNRQTRALAAHVRDKVREAGGEVRNPEGAESGEWVLVDCGDAVVHIMQPPIRAYYKLEDIWGGKSVHLKARQPVEAVRAGAAPGRRGSAPSRAGAGARSAAKPGAKSAARSGAKPAARSGARSGAGAAPGTASGARPKAAAGKASRAAPAARKAAPRAAQGTGAPARKRAKPAG